MVCKCKGYPIELGNRTGFRDTFTICDCTRAIMDRLVGKEWRACLTHGTPYAYTIVKSRVLWLQRHILGLPDGDKRKGDHKNDDPKDYRLGNLRIATAKQNGQNRKKPVTALQHYKGIQSIKGSYRARLRANGGLYYGPYRGTQAAAAKDYDRLAVEHSGEFARTNEALGLFGPEEVAAHG